MRLTCRSESNVPFKKSPPAYYVHLHKLSYSYYGSVVLLLHSTNSFNCLKYLRLISIPYPFSAHVLKNCPMKPMPKKNRSPIYAPSLRFAKTRPTSCSNFIKSILNSISLTIHLTFITASN